MMDSQQLQTMPWEVISIDETTLFDRVKGPEPAIRVNFKMSDGTVSYVVVPRHEANTDVIKQKIHEHATTLTQVLMMEHGPVNQDGITQMYDQPQY